MSGILLHMAKRKDQLLWLQVINRAARSVGDKGTESFRMKDKDETHPTIPCCRSNLQGESDLETSADKKHVSSVIYG